MNRNLADEIDFSREANYLKNNRAKHQETVRRRNIRMKEMIKKWKSADAEERAEMKKNGP